MSMVDVAEKPMLGEALGRIASGVYIVTAQGGETGKVGMLASWVMQAGFKPPQITVALTSDREVFQAIKETGTFSVNVLAKGQNDIMKAFSHYQPDQFDRVKHEASEYGIHLPETIAVLDCKLVNTTEAQDHVIVIAEVMDGKTFHMDAEPFVHLRKSGFHY